MSCAKSRVEKRRVTLQGKVVSSRERTRERTGRHATSACALSPAPRPPLTIYSNIDVCPDTRPPPGAGRGVGRLYRRDGFSALELRGARQVGQGHQGAERIARWIRSTLTPDEQRQHHRGDGGGDRRPLPALSQTLWNFCSTQPDGVGWQLVSFGDGHHTDDINMGGTATWELHDKADRAAAIHRDGWAIWRARWPGRWATCDRHGSLLRASRLGSDSAHHATAEELRDKAARLLPQSSTPPSGKAAGPAVCPRVGALAGCGWPTLGRRRISGR